MKPVLQLAVAALTFASVQVSLAADDMKVLLKLERLVGAEVTASVVLLGNAIDPNSRSIDHRFALKVNGKTVAVPQSVLAQLAYQRRAYSYDALSGGIASSDRKAPCMLGGPARGEKLWTLYLTYSDTQITGSDLRPVMTEASNCLFTPGIEPHKAEARVMAAKALAKLQLLLDLKSR